MAQCTPNPTDTLLAGVAILDEILSPFGFRFEFRAAGEHAGEAYAWGEYIVDDRSLELHYREQLSSVTYFAGGGKASHESYMKQLGLWGRHRFPGASANALGQFHDLAHDLRHAGDFLSGDIRILRAAAEQEAARDALELRKIKALYLGDGERLEELERLFEAGSYSEVLRVFGELKFPDLLEDYQNQMVRLAQEKAGE